MPEYSIIIENRTYKVALIKKQRDGLFEAKINDKPVELQLEKSEIDAFLPLSLKVLGKTYLIELDEIDRRAPFTLKVNNAIFKAQLRESVKKLAPQTPPTQIAVRAERRRGVIIEEGVVVAPMAGKIVSVKVKKGDVVKTGDVVCILEAMKMENEITATKIGKVQEVNVAEGTPVNDGDVLVVIE